jgi:hypothetical protein
MTILLSFFVSVLLGNLLYAIYADLIDKSSYTDWISAFCNVVMATVAVIALVKAKQIWDDKGKDVGHKYAMELLTEVVPTMQVSSALSLRLSFIEANILNVINRPSYTTSQALHRTIEMKKIVIKDCLDEIELLREHSIIEMNNLNASCENLVSQFNMCSISIRKSEAGFRLESQIDNYREFTFLLSQFCYDLEIAFHLFKSDFIYKQKGSSYMNLDSFMDIIDMNTLSNCLSRINDLKVNVDGIENNLNKMKEGRFKPSDYFDFS